MNPRNRNYDAQPRQGMGRTSSDYGRTGRVAYDYRETTDYQKPGIVNLPQDWPVVAFLALVGLLSATLGYVGLHGMGWL